MIDLRAFVKEAEFRQLLNLSGEFIKNPRLMAPTYKATRRTIQTCNIMFGSAHDEDNVSNAFRHALWNFLICKMCIRRLGSVEKAIEWSQKVTDLHEKLFPNRELAKKMDLHNNGVGRLLFAAHWAEDKDPVDLLKIKMKEAVKVRKPEEIEKAGNNLVFIEDLD